MVCAKYMGVISALAALAAVADAGSLSTGVCYAPWHHSSVDSSVIASDFAITATYFQRIRTFQTLFSSVNAIEAAASAGLKIAAGVQLTDASLIDTEIEAVCSGATANPDAVDAIYVGNEDLVNADGSFGSFTSDQLIAYIQRVQECVSGTGIKVGTVQRINEWLETSNAAALYAAADVIGVNIYPFFTNGDDSAVTKLETQWQQLIAAGYSTDKMHVTETGWPYAGSDYEGNTPSYDGMQQYINDFVTWSEGVGNAYYFMMFDTTTSYSGSDYETHFGLFGSDCTTQHVTIPSGDGSTSSNTTTTTTSTAGSTYEDDSDSGDYDDDSTYDDETEATTTSTAGSVAETPAVTPAPTTSTDTTTTTATEAPATATDAATTDAPAATAAPAATPAATTTASTGSTKNCAM